MSRPTSRENLLARVRVLPSGCWEWLGYKDVKGYGQVSYHNQRRPAHRVAYALWVGTPPANLHHVCGFKSCINPQHLEEADPAEHTRMHKTDGNRCINGHPWTPESTYYRRDD